MKSPMNVNNVQVLDGKQNTNEPNSRGDYTSEKWSNQSLLMSASYWLATDSGQVNSALLWSVNKT